MNRLSNIVMLTAFACNAALFAGEQITAKEALKKANLATIEKKIEKKTGQLQQSAAATVNSLQAQIPLANDLPDSDEVVLGRETAGRLLAATPLLKADSLQHYANLIGNWVASRSPRANLPWTFGIIESDDINAFALPGGYVFITTGLYKTLKNEAELASIFGHEIAHVNLRHHVRLMQKERLIAQGSGFLSGTTRKEALKALCGKGAEICARSLDRDAEFEADATGLKYAADAGYDPFAYLDVLDRMGATNQTDKLALLFKTHPHPRDRLASLESKITASWATVSGVVPARWMPIK
jgi:predicted Zn-dependent protease